MVFTVLAAADLYGTKLNYELDFPATPSMEELRQRINAIFGAEAGLRRPAGVPPEPFSAHRMQTFDDNVELWVDLVSMGQLQDYSQVYVFQRETPWHKEVQSKIPPPAKPPASLIAAVPPVLPPAPIVVAPGISPVPITRPLMPPPLDPVGSPARAYQLAAASAAAAHSAAVTAMVHRSPSPVRAVPPPVPVYHPAVPLAPTSLETTHADKVRSVYDDLDPRRTGAVTVDDWCAHFDRLRIEVDGKARDLFKKADRNNDDVVSFQEFDAFSHLYPTLLDSLFYRNRDFWLDKRQKDGIEAAQKRLDQLREREVEARANANEASRSSEIQEGKLRTQKEEVERAQEKERQAQSQLEGAQEATGHSRKAVSDRSADLDATREAERKIQAAQAEATAAQQQAVARKRIQEETTAKAQQRLDDIKQLLADQQAEVDRSRKLEAEHEATLKDAEQRVATEQVELERQQGETRACSERLSDAEKELARAQEHERETGVVQLQARDETARQMVKRDTEERELTACREREEGRRRQEAEAARQVEMQAKVLQGLETENTEHNQKRQKTEEEERELLSSEVSIRAQRDALEEQENNLRSRHTTFHTTTGRAEQPPPRASPARVLPTLPPGFPPPPGSVLIDSRIVGSPQRLVSATIPPAPVYVPPPMPIPVTAASVVRASSNRAESPRR